MALIACPECGGKISTNAPSCPHCGEPVGSSPSKNDTGQSAVHHANSPTRLEDDDAVRFRTITNRLLEKFPKIYLSKKGELNLTDAGNLTDVFAECSDVTKSVFLMGPDWRDRHIEDLNRLPHLVEVRLNDCRDLTDETLMYLSKLSSLKILRLEEWLSGRITLQGLKLLARLRGVELIKLPHLGMQKAGLLDVAGMYKPSPQIVAFMSYLKQQLPDAIIKCE